MGERARAFGCGRRLPLTVGQLAQNVDCNTKLQLSLIIDRRIYTIADQGLVQHRNSKTCWGGLVAWGNNTQPDTDGQIVLGVPFMQGIYRCRRLSPIVGVFCHLTYFCSVLYYSVDQSVSLAFCWTLALQLTFFFAQYVGLAAKPGSINAQIEQVHNALSNGKKAGSKSIS